MNTLLENIEKYVEELPPLSQSVTQLILIVNKEHSSKDLIKIIQTDPLLTGKVLQVSNSAALGRAQKCETIDQAVNFLGDKMVIGIALKIGANQVYDSPLEAYSAAVGELWNHSFRTAIAAREAAAYSIVPGKIDPGLAFTAGLLHDIGKSILSYSLKDDPVALKELTENVEAEQGFLYVEQICTGTNHSEVGGMMAEHWKLPLSLVETIKNHHAPKSVSDDLKPLLYTIHVADIIAMMSGSGTGIDSMHYVLDPEFEEYLKISRKDMELLMLNSAMEFEKFVKSMNI